MHQGDRRLHVPDGRAVDRVERGGQVLPLLEARRRVGRVPIRQLEDRAADAHPVERELDAVEAVERVVRFAEHISEHEPLEPGGEYEGTVGRADRNRTHRAGGVEIQRLLRHAGQPVEPVGLIDVGREHLRFREAAVDRAREDQSMVAEHVRQ